jgi:plastocyanin
VSRGAARDPSRTLPLRAAVALALALVAILALGRVAGLPTGPARASAADCTWQRHSKRVVRHVRREGKLRRVVRQRRWWSCEPAAAEPALGPAPVASPAPSPAPAAPGGPDPEPDPGIARLGVKAVEYSYTLSRPSVAPGELIVELDNQGEDAHNLNLQREGGAEPALEVTETGPLEHRTARFTLTPGTYRLWCSLPTHEEEGMVSTLVVKES